MRFLLILIAAITVAPSYAQRVFRATPIDLMQNERLGSLEVRMDSVESSAADPVSEPLTIDRPADSDPVPVPTLPQSVEPVDVSLPYSHIVKHGADWCAPCKAFDKHPRPTIERKWTVIDADPDGRSIPWFEVVIGEKRYEHNGPLSLDDLHAIVNRHNGTTTVSIREKPEPILPARYTIDELRQKIRAVHPRPWRGPIYADVQPRTAAKQHLVGPEHGFTWDQVRGLTQDEALILHDYAPGHGNKIFPVRFGRATSHQPGWKSDFVQKQSQPTELDCANGGSATPQYQFSRSGWRPGKLLFGR